ncbi:MAG: hypothetical protein CMJ46_16210 [Planctomyces sp.]|nr:hypothetical protein [Planctomyces sp.]
MSTKEKPATRIVEQKVKQRQPDGTTVEVPIRMEVEAFPRKDGSPGVIPRDSIGKEVTVAPAVNSAPSPDPKPAK